MNLDQIEEKLIIVSQDILELPGDVMYSKQVVLDAQRRVVQLNNNWIDFLAINAKATTQIDMFGGR